MKEFWQPGWPDLKYLCERESCSRVKNSGPLLLRSRQVLLCYAQYILYFACFIPYHIITDL
jgi:hypothetical protein